MRASHLFVGFITVGVFACSSSGGNHIVIDAAVADTPPDAFQCAFKPGGKLDDTGTAPLDFSTGTGQATGSVPAGKTELETGANITFTDSAGTPDGTGFGIFMVNRAGVFSAAAGEAGIFEKPAALGTYTMDPDMTIGFGIDFFDGVTSTAITPTQVYLLDNTVGTPSVQLTSWTPTPAPNMMTNIGATMTNATYQGFSVEADGTTLDMQAGCTVQIVHFAFINLNVKWQAAPFPTTFAPGADAGKRSFTNETLNSPIHATMAH